MMMTMMMKKMKMKEQTSNNSRFNKTTITAILFSYRIRIVNSVLVSVKVGYVYNVTRNFGTRPVVVVPFKRNRTILIG
jgi:hypothetical protein